MFRHLGIECSMAGDDFLCLVFMPLHPLNSPSLIVAHVRFVAPVCTMQRWPAVPSNVAPVALDGKWRAFDVSAMRLFTADRGRLFQVRVSPMAC